MNAKKIIPKNLLLSVNFNKFFLINKKNYQSQSGVWRAVIGGSSVLSRRVSQI